MIDELSEHEWNPRPPTPRAIYNLIARDFRAADGPVAQPTRRLAMLPESLERTRSVLGAMPKVHIEDGRSTQVRPEPPQHRRAFPPTGNHPAGFAEGQWREADLPQCCRRNWRTGEHTRWHGGTVATARAKGSARPRLGTERLPQDAPGIDTELPVEQILARRSRTWPG